MTGRRRSQHWLTQKLKISKGIVMRPAALRAATARAAAKLGKMRTRLAAGEKPNRKRMATLVTVYDAGPAAPPARRHRPARRPPR